MLKAWSHVINFQFVFGHRIHNCKPKAEQPTDAKPMNSAPVVLANRRLPALIWNHFLGARFGFTLPILAAKKRSARFKFEPTFNALH